MLFTRIARKLVRVSKFTLRYFEFLSTFIPNPISSKPYMKLGASINLFDGEELLLDQLLCLRKNIDFISVVYQLQGHWGALHPRPYVKEYLEYLVSEDLIDLAYEWKPERNESNVEDFNQADMLKRQVGLKLAQNVGCTHFINLDNDEFYTSHEFEYMKRVMGKSKKYDASVVKHLQYYKSTEFIKRKPEQEYVLGIFPIKQNTSFEYGVALPYPIDPGRKIPAGKIREFFRFEVQMHHLSYVRRSLEEKLTSSHAVAGNLPHLKVMLDRFNNYKYPQPGIWGHGMEVELKRIEPQIHTPNFDQDSYQLWAESRGFI